MVFTGVPVFLDPPNWQQDHPGGGGGSDAIRGGSILTAGGGHGGPLDNEIRSISMLNPPPPQTVPIMVSADSGGTTTSRPTLMADRARLAKLPPPDTNLKCPRCESINTKFCYYNNYSLSQPRYFCKTCRRYWTKGGSLRSVPVGGGCRRNKRNKSGGGNSRSQVMDTSSATSSGGAPALSSSNCTGEMVGNHHNHPHLPILPFLPSVHGFLDYGRDTSGTGFPVAASRDLVFPGVGNSLSLDFMAANDIAEDGNLGQWRMQQHLPAIPFPRSKSLVHIEPQLLLPYEGDGSIEAHQYLATAVSQLKTNPSLSNLSEPTDTIRLEEDRSKNLTYMSANGWGDFTNFPSTTNSLL